MFKIKSYEEKERKYILFMLLSAIFTIVEVSAIVFIPEERAKLYPAKFCYRYLAPVFIPLLIMLLKCKKEECKLNKKMIGVLVVSFAYLIWYYIGGEDWVTAIDAPMLLTIQMVNTKKEGMTIAVTIIFAIIALIAIILNKLKKVKDIRKIFIPVLILTCIVILPFQCIFQVGFSRDGFAGKALKGDFVAMSNYIKRDYEKVYLVQGEDDISLFIRAFFGYSMTDYEVINWEDGDTNIEIKDKKVAVIISNKFEGNLSGVAKKEVGLTHMSVYENEEGAENLKVEF